ncbi:cellulosome protein, partial [Bacteroidales bacterium OttesenSCG-928-J19]|nr:cellulosome protein [Bacteroidales bacterium OttesenSCG-928-J19]
MKHLKILLCVLFIVAGILPSTAQRKMESLDRGVVAVKNASGNYLISWRYLATDPEDLTFNVYIRKKGETDFTKLNTDPLTVTNYQAGFQAIGNGTEIKVKTMVKGVEQDTDGSFTVSTAGFLNYRTAFLEISYDPAADGLALADYNTKFIWPVDLNGDGKYDYVVDRLSTTGGTHKVQGYLSDGTLLWTIDMGPNVNIDQGHNDMVIAYDMDCNGKGDVVIKSSDGTRFWDKANNTWGKYLLDAANGDTDGDGIIDYNKQSVKNPPQYITILDGMTGAEKATIEMKYPEDKSNGHKYTRTNKGQYMGEDYNNLNGHMAIAYLDGIHPSIVMEYMCRTNSNSQWGQTHHYYASAWGYKFVNGQATDWEDKYHWSRSDASAENGVHYAEFHHIRAGDVNNDGMDEMLDGGFALKSDGTPLFSAGIAHGDRFRVSDIDPERPGLETFAIQQNASDMLGMIIYDAGTGESIKRWYMGAVGDVGRGECMDISAATPGYEVFSTMGNIYDAKGNMVYEGNAPFPREGVWWDGDLFR